MPDVSNVVVEGQSYAFNDSDAEARIAALTTEVNDAKTYQALAISFTASASNLTYSNAAITADMRVVECVWGTPANVQSDITWTTSAGKITLAGTFGGSTTVNMILIKTN